MSFSVLLKKIDEVSDGFVLVTQNKAIFENNKGQRFETILEDQDFEETVLSFSDLQNKIVRSYSIDSNSAVIIIGEPKSEKKECELLANMMYESGIKPDSETISALVGYQFDVNKMLNSDELIETKQNTEKDKETESKIKNPENPQLKEKKNTSVEFSFDPRQKVRKLISILGGSIASIVMVSIILAVVVLPNNITDYDNDIVAHADEFEIDTSLNNEGDRLYQQGNYQESLRWYENSLKDNPVNSVVLNNMGVTLAQIGKYDEAIVMFDRALEINPDHVGALANSGVALNYITKYDEAIIIFDRALAIEPNHVGALANKGVALAQIGKYDEAIVMFDRALEINPDHVGALANKGVALAQIGKYDEAIVMFDRALEINPDQISALSSKAMVFVQLGKYDEAIVMFDRALEINPDYTPAIDGKEQLLAVMDR